MAESISNNSSSSASYGVRSISLGSDKGAQQAVREVTDDLAKKGIKRDQELLLHKDQKKEGILKYLLKPATVAKSLFERFKYFFLIKLYGVNVTHKGNTDMFIPFGEVMQLFGYAVRKEGVCFSIAGAAGRSCIRKGVPEFIKRMELICAINKAAYKAGYIPRTEETEETEEERKAREAIKDKVIGELLPNGGIYSEDAHQLLNFFDEMSVSDNYISKEWQKALGHSGRQDLEEARWESDGDALESRELYLKESFITAHHNFFAKNKLQNFLQKLRDKNGDKPWHVMISFSEHTCSIGFDGLKFLVSDHDRQIYTDNLSRIMRLIHNNSDFSVKWVCLQIFGAKEDDLSINTKAKTALSDVQITEKKVLKDGLLHVAARYGVTETVKSLLQKILSGKQKNSVDMPEPIFPRNSYIQKIKQFLQLILQRILALFQKEQSQKKEQSQTQKEQSQAELVKEYSDCINTCMINAYVYNKPQIMQVSIQTIVTEIDNNEFLSDTKKKELLRKFLFGKDSTATALWLVFRLNRFKVAKVYIHTVMSAIENTFYSLPSEHKRELQIDLLGKGKDKENPIYDFILRLNDEEINKLFFSVISADQLDELVSEKWSIDYLREAHKKATEQQ